jgi:hypothetical protein
MSTPMNPDGAEAPQGTSTPFGVTALDPMADEDRDPVLLPPDTEEGRKPQVRQIAEGIEASIPGTRLPSGGP